MDTTQPRYMAVITEGLFITDIMHRVFTAEGGNNKKGPSVEGPFLLLLLNQFLIQQWQIEIKHRPFTQFTFHTNFTAVIVNDLLRNIKAHP
jgi:hypothetical protein